MGAGLYRHFVSLQQPGLPTTNEYGETTRPWVTWISEWARMDPPSLSSMKGAAETILGGAETPQDLVIFRIRMHTGLGTVGQGWRVLADGKSYNIKAARVDNLGVELEIFAVVGTSP